MNAKVIIESGRNGDPEYLALSIDGNIFRMSGSDYLHFPDKHNGLSVEEYITNLADEIHHAIDGRMF